MGWGKLFQASLFFLGKRRGTLILSLLIGVLTTFLIVSGLKEVQATGQKLTPGLNPEQPDAGNDNSLTVGTSPDFEPFEYYSGTEIVGFDIDLMDALGTKLGVAVDYIPVPFSAVLDGLVAGSYDAAISGLTITPGREESVDFTLPYLMFGSEPLGIAVQQGDSEQRRAFNEALWQLREDGTLETIRAGVDAYFSDVTVDLADWPLVNQEKEALLSFTNTQGTETAVQIPAGVVSDTIMLTFTPIYTDTIPTGFSVVAQPFELDVYQDGKFEEKYHFLAPVTFQISYAASDIVGIDEESIMLDYWDTENSRWQDAACGLYDRQPQNNRLSVKVCHPGRFAFVQESFSAYLPSLHAK